MNRWKFSILAVVGACALLSACLDDSSSGPQTPSEDRGESSRVVSQHSSSSNIQKNSSSSMFLEISSSSQMNKVLSSSSDLQSSSSSMVLQSSSSNVILQSSSSESAESWRETCLDVINEYRATENLPPLTLAPDAKQTCTDDQAAADLAENSAHGHFGTCGEGAQNSGPNVRMSSTRTYADYAKMYLKMMWEDEKALVESGAADPDKDADYPKIGHYLNMKGAFKTVACGFAVTADGKTGWLNINFFRR